MPRSRRFGRSRVTLILLVVASLAILTLDYRESGVVQGARGAVGTVFSPFRSVGDAIATPFRNGWKGISGYEDLEDENTDLRRQLDEVRGQQIAGQAQAEENERLRKLLGLSISDDIPRVVAEVTSGPLTSFDTTFEIDKGSGDGLAPGMPVITDSGLVGRVLRVEGGRARIQLITDPDFPGVGIKLVESRDIGLAQGSADGTLVVKEGITLGTPVTRGEAVVTSGYERSSYPGGIPVGTVASVGRTADRTEQTLVIEPSAELDSLSYVVVLLCDEDCG